MEVTWIGSEYQLECVYPIGRNNEEPRSGGLNNNRGGIFFVDGDEKLMHIFLHRS